MDKYFNPKVLKILIGVAVVLLGISIILLKYGRPSFSESQVDFEIEGPEQVESGQEVEWTLKIGNRTKTELKNIDITFIYPSESVVLDEDGNILERLDIKKEIDSLNPGDKEEFKFKGFVVGSRGDIRLTTARMSFRAGSLRSSFEKIDELSTTITKVPVSLTLAAAPNILPNQNITYTLDYRNESNQDILDVRFVMKYPDGFVISRTSPATTGNNNWTDDVLRVGESGRITIEGVISGQQGQTKEIMATLERRLGDEYVAYAQAKNSSIVASPILAISGTINDVSDYTSFAGDVLRYRISYKNNSNFNLTGLSINSTLEGDMYDLNTVSVPSGFYNSATRTVIWDSGSIPELALLKPGQSGEVVFTVKTKNNFPNSGLGNYFVKLTNRIFSSNVPAGYNGNQIAASSVITTKIGSQPSFSQSGFFNDSAYGSSGPNPPTVGQSTTLTIHWRISNPGNDIKNGVIRGTLPSGVTWKNNVSVGSGQSEPTFNPNTSEVVWNIGSIPQGTGIGSAPFEATFQVSIQPNISQSGQAVTLVRGSRFTGVDSFTNQQININSGDINTGQMTDAINNGAVLQ